MRGFILAQLVVVLGLVALTGVVYYRYSGKVNPENQKPVAALPTPVPENKYENSQFGFNLTLPDGFKIEEEAEEEFYKREKADYRKNFTSYVKYEPQKVLGIFETQDATEKNVLSIWIFDNPANLTPEKFYNEYWYFPYVWGMFNPPDKRKDAPSQIATISGIVANYAEISYQDNTPKFYYLPVGEKMFLIRVFNEGEEILKSFKLLQSASPNDLTDQEIADIKNEYAKKFSNIEDGLVITVRNITKKYNGEFATGAVNNKNGGGGFSWIMAKVNGEWKIAFEGNGLPTCSEIAPYNLPSELMPTCADKDGNIINRL